MRLARICFVLTFFASQVTAAEASEIHCPSVITTEQSLVPKVDDWQPFIDLVNDAKNQLDGIQMYDGPPEDNASLRPKDKRLPSKGAHQLTWTFGPAPARDLWLACTYQGTSIKLTKNLGRKVSSCVATVNQFYVPLKTVCK